MDTVPDLVARERRSDAPAFAVPERGRTYDYHDLCTTAYKAGNFLRYLGVRDGGTVVVASDPQPQAVFTFLGAALLGAVTRFDPVSAEDPVDGRVLDDAVDALVVPAGAETRYAVPPGCSRCVYGDDPDDPAVDHWERGVWSENPAFPPREYDRGAAVLADGDWSHADCLSRAHEVVDAVDLSAEDRVALRGPLADPAVVVGGVLAPLVVGGCSVLPDESTVADVAVVSDRSGPAADAVPEPRVVGGG